MVIILIIFVILYYYLLTYKIWSWSYNNYLDNI
jgi:hypothetical protein